MESLALQAVAPWLKAGPRASLESVLVGGARRTTWTRNIKAWNERIETGVLVKSQKGTNVSVERKVEDCFQWKANGQCSRGDSSSFNHGSHSGQQAQSSSSTSRAPTQTDGRKPCKFGNLRGESPSGLKGRRPCRKSLEERAQNRRVISGTLPCA